MAGKGGYQAPANPAPASGPGKLSKRTDGGPAQKLRDLPDAQYGEAKTFRELQQGAPLAQTPGPQAQGAPSFAAAKDLLTPLDAPSERPNEPVTAGAALGAGPGPEVLGQVGGAPGKITDLLSQLQPYDLTGSVGALLAEALRKGA